MRLFPVQFKSEGYFLYNKVPVDVCQLVWSAAICLHKSHENETIIYHMFQNHETNASVYDV